MNDSDWNHLLVLVRRIGADAEIASVMSRELDDRAAQLILHSIETQAEGLREHLLDLKESKAP